MPYNSFVHYLQLGGILCELTAKIVFNEYGCCCNFFLYVLVFLLWPIILLFFSEILGGVMTFYVYEALFKKCMQGFKSAGNRLSNMKAKLCILRVCLQILFIISFCLTWALILSILLAVALVIGTLIFGITIVPSLILYLVIVIKLNKVWSNRKSNPNQKATLDSTAVD